MRTNIKLLIILLSLVAATAVSAAPTMCGCNKNCDCNRNFVTSAVLPASNAPAPYVPETSQINQSFNSRLAAIGAEILEPPPEFTDFSPVGAKTLPPVPAAFFMVLTGFLCVSLVKDRRVWLAALAGLLWAGQAGFQAIPQLATNISKHIQRKTTANIALLHRSEDLFRLRSDIEGTRYIGLLRHLEGIPERKERPHVKRGAKYLAPPLRRGFLQFKTTQFAIAHFSFLLNLAVICPAVIAEQNTYFSPAFIFARLARGPPNFT